MNRVLMIGDIHGSFKPFRALRERLGDNEPRTVICLGDVGTNFYFNHRDSDFKAKLGSYNFTYFIVRGNHEERAEVCAQAAPEQWGRETFWGNEVWVEKAFPYIKYALDAPAAYEIPIGDETRETLVLPGAYSVDKQFRVNNGWSWFAGEQLSEEEMALGSALATGRKWDMVLSHTCPAIYVPTDLFLPTVDQSAVDTTMERWMGEIERELDYRLWAFGHYHRLRAYPKYEGKQMLMLFNEKALDVNRFFETGEVDQSLV